MNIFFVTDNRNWYKKISKWKKTKGNNISIFCSPKGEKVFRKEIETGLIFPLNVTDDTETLIQNYQLGISCHCKQLFPSKLVDEIPCFNFHPGLNPYNRGWFPQVFSILNGLPAGATIHKMDSKIDHGPIIAQKRVDITASDTSKTVYDRVLESEFELFDKWINKIINGNYEVLVPESNGNYNSIHDFKALCEIDLNRKVSFSDAIDYLRAMSFEGYDNAFFYDENGKKIFVSISIKKEE